ncbi:integration host factor subunit alpha [Ottowia beijingensis]|uniref:Integration host factor subunit alpha n=1 Tax=Ottowia beijingensis TaxID=1207057 RepID=A0A853INY3_9BURK|nr:integration host factor subunit alpha [Ottowia beijingensis]
MTAQPTDFLALAVDSLETSALTKAQLAEMLFEQIGLNKRESKDMVDAFFDVISAELVAGGEVKLSGFGNFQMRVKAPRPGRNPRTGELIPIAARRVVTFHASQKLKDQLQADAAPVRRPTLLEVVARAALHTPVQGLTRPDATCGVAGLSNLR